MAPLLPESLDSGLLKRKMRDAGLRNPEVRFVLSALPMHGTLTLDNENVTEGSSFTQRDVNKGKVIYEHDHSDSLWDAFEYQVQVRALTVTLA